MPVRFPVTFASQEDLEVAKAKAKAAKATSLSAYILTLLGLEPPEHGGARPGTGPKPKKKANKKGKKL